MAMWLFIAVGYAGPAIHGDGLVAFGAARTAAAELLVGRASVIDGDTLELRGERVRLWGIDAPESRQLCERAGERWRCGQAAALALDAWLAGRTVRCEGRDRDRWQRLIALCRVAGEDVGRWLVRNGHALAFRRYSRDYVGEEELARADRVGVWEGSFALPWAWRADGDAAPMITAAAAE
jgi:endonuclease YncB( thermonuclease family)